MEPVIAVSAPRTMLVAQTGMANGKRQQTSPPDPKNQTDEGRQSHAQTSHGHRENEIQRLKRAQRQAAFRIIAGTARQMGLEIVD
jgi:ribosomal protein L11